MSFDNGHVRFAGRHAITDPVYFVHFALQLEIEALVSDIARSQQAKLWEARALASLCQLLHSQGRDEGCRQQLAELYAWFTEGFETEDLRAVRTVLQEIT